jgi:hypothetical protein
MHRRMGKPGTSTTKIARIQSAVLDNDQRRFEIHAITVDIEHQARTALASLQAQPHNDLALEEHHLAKERSVEVDRIL